MKITNDPNLVSTLLKMDPAKDGKKAESAIPGEPFEIEDQLTITQEDKDGNTYKVDRQTIAKLKVDIQQNTQTFKKMIKKMLHDQGLKWKDVLEAIENGEELTIEISDEVREAAKANVAEDGFWGVEATSKRILDFAKAISGGDPSKIDMLEDAFKEAYKEAEEAFGGELPEISQQTYDKVLEGFESWRNEGAVE
jgi:hypothetical protein